MDVQGASEEGAMHGRGCFERGGPSKTPKPCLTALGISARLNGPGGTVADIEDIRRLTTLKHIISITGDWILGPRGGPLSNSLSPQPTFPQGSRSPFGALGGYFGLN